MSHEQSNEDRTRRSAAHTRLPARQPARVLHLLWLDTLGIFYYYILWWIKLKWQGLAILAVEITNVAEYDFWNGDNNSVNTVFDDLRLPGVTIWAGSEYQSITRSGEHLERPVSIGIGLLKPIGKDELRLFYWSQTWYIFCKLVWLFQPLYHPYKYR